MSTEADDDGWFVEVFEIATGEHNPGVTGKHRRNTK